ncbi:MAG: TrmB family transcriptional regulator [Candidatus Heimdallarchaeaceae archaeon]
MSKQSTLVDQLKLLGFSEYESRAFLEIVKLGKASAPELAKATKIPQAKIYGVLDELYNKGFVGKDEDSKPSIYFADKPIKRFNDFIKQFSNASTNLSDALERLYETAGGAHEYGFHSVGNFTEKLRSEDYIYIFASDDTLFNRFFKGNKFNFYPTGGDSDALIACARHRMITLIDKGDRVQFVAIEDPLFSLAIDQLMALSSVNRSLTTEMNDIQELEGEKILYIDSIRDVVGPVIGQNGTIWISNKRLFVKIPGGITYARPIIALETCELNPDGRLEITIKGSEGIEKVVILPESDSQIILNLLEFVKANGKK